MNKIFFCLLLLMAPAAHALMITQTSTVTADHTDPGIGSFGGAFQQFNPALGHLDSVNLSFNGTMVYDASFSVTNPSSCTIFPYCMGGVTLSDVYQVHAPDFVPHVAPGDDSYISILLWKQSVSYNYINGVYSYYGSNGHFTSPYPLPQTSGPMSIGYSGSPTSFDGYVGNGTVLIDGAWEGDFLPEHYGILPSWDSHMTLTTTLTYTYTPSVAEPPVMLVFATGLLALGWGVRRSKRT